MLSACKKDQACEQGFDRETTPAPDSLHVARTFETFCGGPGAAQDNFAVSVKPARGGSERRVFIVEDHPPQVRWTAADHLEIRPVSWDWIGESERDAEGIRIAYVVNLGSIRASLLREQQRIADAFPQDAARINASSQKQFDTFTAWAMATAKLEDGR